jgi:hypothetical protein
VLLSAIVACKSAPSEQPAITPEPVIAKPAPSTSTSASAPVSSSIVEERAWKACGDAKKVPTSYASVRAVDWCNREYIVGFASLRRGQAEIHEYATMGGAHDTDIFLLGSVAYGDLDGDGLEEAAVVLDHQSFGANGGEHYSSQVFVFSLRKGAVVEVARLEPNSVVTIEKDHLLVRYPRAGTICTRTLDLRKEKLVEWSDSCSGAKK